MNAKPNRQTENLVKNVPFMFISSRVWRNKFCFIFDCFPKTHKLKTFRSVACRNQNAFKVTWMDARQCLAKFLNRRTSRFQIASMHVENYETVFDASKTDRSSLAKLAFRKNYTFLYVFKRIAQSEGR